MIDAIKQTKVDRVRRERSLMCIAAGCKLARERERESASARISARYIEKSSARKWDSLWFARPRRRRRVIVLSGALARAQL